MHAPPVRNAQYSPMNNLGEMFGFTSRARVPEGQSGGAVRDMQSERMSSAGNQQLDVLSKLLILLGLLIVLGVLFL